MLQLRSFFPMAPCAWLAAAALAAGLACAADAVAQPSDSGKASPAANGGKSLTPSGSKPAAPDSSKSSAPDDSKPSVADQIREALSRPIVVPRRRKGAAPAMPSVRVTVSGGAQARSGSDAIQQQVERASARANGGVVPESLIPRGRFSGERNKDTTSWNYGDGAIGPDAWGQLKPEYAQCTRGQRQSPISIDTHTTLLGPAEPLVFTFQPSSGTVVDNGRTLLVDVTGNNFLSVRGQTFRLLRVEFHHPAETQVDGRTFAMDAQLIFRDDAGQLAVVAVLLAPGATTNPLVQQVWTYLPLDTGDSVPVPPALLDFSTLLPQDPRYFQFIGSLTTPPCSEGVLWMVFQTPAIVSPIQLKLLARLYPDNARPPQSANGRIVRQAE